MVKYNAAAHVSYKSPFVYMHKGVQFRDVRKTQFT